MRSATRRRSWLGTLFLLPLLVGGAGGGEKAPEVDDGIDVYFRDADLGALADQDLEKYIETDAGESTPLDRAFPDAPPQIPHTVEDMLPITAGSNDCLDCHHPDNVTDEEERPIPKSHFRRAVMAKGKKGEAMAWVVRGYEKTEDVVGARYDCSMCHAAQATNVRTPRTDFVAVKAAEGR
jgi:nitrate reductase cytochrome c-type subunit